MTWWEHAAAQIEVAVFATDARGTVMWCNACAASMFASEPAALIGSSIARVIPGADALLSGRRAERVRLVGLRDNAVEFPLELAIARGVDGSDVKCLLVVRDLAEDVQLEPPQRKSRPTIDA
ncbi:MAG: PAS domain-containing protein [Deltaproteobacteria bacterium]|nr:PAS domain-containing protein [Deltaproteobacteria bacterium]